MKKAETSLILIFFFLAMFYLYPETLFVHAQPPADAVQANPQSIEWQHPPHNPGETFTVYVDVINVAGLLGFQCGFRFNHTVLQVVQIEVVGFLGPPGPGLLTWIPEPPWDNQNGIVPAWGAILIDPKYAKSGSGHLLEVTMQINPALWPPYSGTYPGTPVPMIDLTNADGDICELKLIYLDGFSEVTPFPEDIHDGNFTLLYALKGDVNGDWIVNIKDATQVGLYWLQTIPPAPGNVDVNGDGIINVKDATLIGLNWLKS